MSQERPDLSAIMSYDLLNEMIISPKGNIIIRPNLTDFEDCDSIEIKFLFDDQEMDVDVLHIPMLINGLMQAWKLISGEEYQS